MKNVNIDEDVKQMVLSQIKSIDMKQQGILGYIFNYGNIDVSSTISGGVRSIVMKNVWPVREAYFTLSRQIEKEVERRERIRDHNDYADEENIEKNIAVF